MENKRGFIMRNGTCIGMDVQRIYTSTPVGVIQAFSGNIIPRGFLLCDGASYKVAEYPDLYAVIGNTYGGDDANFNVPDYRETVLVGVGENTTDTIADHDVYELGEFKDDQFQGHWHNLGNSNGTVTVALGASIKGSNVQGANPGGENRYTVDLALDAITDGTNGEPRTGTTTHGKQKGVTYIIKAFHTNEGTDSGVSDDVIEYVEGEIAEVETALPNIKKFANPSGTAKYITISGATLGDIEVHSAYAGKYMFTSTGAKPIFFGTSTYLGYTLTGWAWNSDKTKLYLRVNGHRDFVISAFGSDGVEISDMTTTAPTDVTFNATFNYNAYIDNSTSENTSTYSSAKIDKKFAPRHFGTDNKTLWLKLQLGAMTTHEPITVTDQYGGQVKILGMYDLSTYKSVKVIRLSYGDWSTHSGTDFSNTSSGDANYKIRRLFYCPDDNNYYLEIRQYSYISVEGAPDATMVTSLPVEESAMTLIPESQFASKSDLVTANKRIQGASPLGEMYYGEYLYRKLTTTVFYGRETVFEVSCQNYLGQIMVLVTDSTYVRVIDIRGTRPYEVKYSNTTTVESGKYSLDLFIHKTTDIGTITIRPVIQSVDNYTTVYDKNNFVYSTESAFTSAPKTATYQHTVINDSSTGDTTSTWSSSKIAEYVAENAAPSYSGTVIPTKIASGATVTTDWDISSAGSNADYGRLLMLNSNAGTFLIYVKGNLGNTSTIPTPTVISSIGNSQSSTWSSSFELSISSGKLRIKNKSGAVASWRFV